MIASLLLLALIPQVLNVLWGDVAYDFGAVPRESYELKHEFRFTNDSDSPVTISYAVASCSCISLDWTREAVAPGSEGKVSVVYFKESTADSFDKIISVFFADASKPQQLRISGHFVETGESLRQDFPFRRGALGLQYDPGDFATVHPGEPVYQNLWLANFSSQGIDVNLEDFSDGFEITPSHVKIASGSRRELMCILRPDSLQWGRRSYAFTPVVDGEPVPSVTYSAVVLPDWSALSSAEINSSAYFKVIGDVHHFGVIRKGDPAHLIVSLQNVSGKAFRILDIRASIDGVTIDAPSEIAAGAKADLDVNIDPSALVAGGNKFTLSLVTDTPLKPFAEIEVMGYVEH